MKTVTNIECRISIIQLNDKKFGISFSTINGMMEGFGLVRVSDHLNSLISNFEFDQMLPDVIRHAIIREIRKMLNNPLLS